MYSPLFVLIIVLLTAQARSALLLLSGVEYSFIRVHCIRNCVLQRKLD